MDISNELGKYSETIEEYLNEILPKSNSLQKRIFESMRYSIFAGGKRLRPFLILKTCEIFNGDYKEALPFAAAMEMIHTYSLIHDDLPCMDNDDFRRGKPTNHKVYGENLAILAGDGLLNFAYETMISHVFNTKSNSERYLKALKEISNAAGVFGMIGGQVVDIESEDSGIDQRALDFIHNNKTSALIEASIVSGAIIGGANDDEINLLRDYGKSIGLGFQIRDDILDKIGDMDKLGKDIGSDEDNHKATYVSLYGMDSSIEKSKELYNFAITSLNKFDKKNINILKELAYFLLNRDM
ncbi:polyprenyl synthetase family protein [Dethiothermospora halolimnae]|uniref:polyprenyl synthetase family protein n=1 Tax=Dethiothermospora halolimnae TaxID=3114390 RepID=UPI003CCBEBF7